MKKIILILFMFCLTLAAYSQVNRRMGMREMTPPAQSNVKIEKKDPVETAINYLKEELSLDSFQEAAVKSYIQDNISKGERANAQSLNPDEKRIKFEELKNEFDNNVKSILKPEQIVLYDNIANKSKGDKKSKKEKRKKKKED